jgi:DNA-binding NarL/FixJ family response regulator
VNGSRLPDAVVLGDEVALSRTALAQALLQAGVRRVAEAGDVAQAHALVRRTRPDVVLVSESLSGGGVSTFCAQHAGREPVLVLSPTTEHASLLGALTAGAQGYLGRDEPLSALLAALQALHRGEAVVPRRMLGGLLHDLVQQRRRADEETSRVDALSRREREVLELLAEGMGQVEIAAVLVISPQTARTHIQNVISKLGVHSRVEAVALAREHVSGRAS